jgi:hypothetical protein
VEGLLWREIAQAYGRAQVGIGGRLLTTKLDLAPRWYAIGLATDPGTAVNLQGYHASHMLVILDEADGIAPQIWTALDGVLTSAGAKILAVGNPLDPTSEFKKRHDLALTKSTAKCIKIAADDVLPLTDAGEHPYLLQRSWVEDKAARWGKGSALYMGKIEAEWPDQGVDTLIPISWLQRAKGRAVTKRERTLGVDVARQGTNRTVRTLMAGGWMEWSKATSKEDTMQTAGRVHQDIEQYGPIATAVDDSGVGGGVVDRLRQLGRSINAVNNGETPDDKQRFANKGSEMWWAARTAFENDEIGFDMSDPDAIEELINDLNRPRYETDERARIKVDKHGLKRGQTTNSLSDEALAATSPDRGDSFVLAFAAAKPFLKPRVLRPRNLIEGREGYTSESRIGYDPATGAAFDTKVRRAWLEKTGQARAFERRTLRPVLDD